MAFQTIHVALAGNPNSGKTSIFNNLTGAHQRVANYPGVTIETYEGVCERAGVRYRIVDLPGTYSLTANSPEEQIARDYLLQARPDVVVQVVDACALERSLNLTLQLLELGARVVLDLNMIDEAERRGLRLDCDALARALGIEVVATIGHRNVGTDRLLDAVARASRRAPAPLPLRYSDAVESLADALAARIADANGAAPFTPRWAAIRYLEGDPDVRRWVRRELRDGERVCAEFDGRRRALEMLSGESLEAAIAQTRYEWIARLLQQSPVQRGGAAGRTPSDRIDAVLLHRIWGLPLLAVAMFLLFQFVFTLGAPLADVIEAGMGALGTGVRAALGPGPLSSLLVDGVISGVGMIIVFLPNIMLLFLALGLLERSGYLARAAFLLDRLLSSIGLHGRSFIPLLAGFGCSVPAIMATRTLENERDRLATMLVIPLMSCSARLPIYVLLIPAFFPLAWQGFMFVFMYALGIVLAIVLVKLLRATVLAGEPTPFVMELPPYRWPTLRSIVNDMLVRTRQFLVRAGTIILAVAVILWAATSYPKKPAWDVDRSPAVAAMTPAELEQARRAEAVAYSITGRLGHALEPVFRPLGFDWRICTGLVGAMAAREVFIAQLGIVFSLGADAETSLDRLRDTMAREYTPLQGLSLLLFCLIAQPCMSTFAVMRRESNSWKWALLQTGGLTLLAYGIAMVVYQLGVRLG